MSEEINTPESLAGGAVNTPPDGGGADSDVVSVKELLSKELGKDFPSDEAALKAVKDTFDYVGKVGKIKPVIEKLQQKFGGEAKVIQLMEEMANGTEQKPDDSKFVSREQYETDTFFATRPDYQEHRELIEALRVKTGKTLSEVIELPAFKGVFEKAKAHDASEKSKSVLHTNPRLGQATDKISQANQALKNGDHEAAKTAAVSAVLDAFNL